MVWQTILNSGHSRGHLALSSYYWLRVLDWDLNGSVECGWCGCEGWWEWCSNEVFTDTVMNWVGDWYFWDFRQCNGQPQQHTRGSRVEMLSRVGKWPGWLAGWLCVAAHTLHCCRAQCTVPSQHSLQSAPAQPQPAEAFSSVVLLSSSGGEACTARAAQHGPGPGQWAMTPQQEPRRPSPRWPPQDTGGGGAQCCPS